MEAVLSVTLPPAGMIPLYVPWVMVNQLPAAQAALLLAPEIDKSDVVTPMTPTGEAPGFEMMYVIG